MIKSTLFIITALMALVVYYNFYLAPRDAALNEIMVCMDNDRSREAYDRCIKTH